MLVKELTRSFAGGEITPEMYGRLDNVKFQTGLALCRNARVLPHGPASKRPGTYYVNKAGNPTYPVRLIPFAFSATQTMVLELGQYYMRFHTLGATLLSGGSPYQIATNWAAADIFDIKFTQSADVVTMSHPNYPTYELRRVAALNWTLTAPSLGASPALPGTPTVATTAGTGTAYPKDAYYKVTTVTADGVEESLGTAASAAASNDLTLQGAKNVVSWTTSGLAGCSYRVYKANNEVGRLYGYIGETTALSFTDDYITPDYSRNPPATTIRLDVTNYYPGCVAYYEQRRVFSGAVAAPQTVYGTRSGTESNLNASLPASASDALSFTIKAQQQNAVQHLVPLNDLLALTVGGVWKIGTGNDTPLTPTTLSVRPQSFNGASKVRPQVTTNSCLYVEANGRRVRDISFQWQSQVYTSEDRSIMAPHLFNGHTIVDSAYAKSPEQIAWFVRDDGVLLGMSYVPEHQVFGWHQHVTNGRFESICVVSENNEDVLYAVVARTLAGVATRTIERMASMTFTAQEDCFYVDCGATYSGAPATSITGLSYLEGSPVAVLADGAVVNNMTVSGGAIVLPAAASKVHVGLAFSADLQTLPMALEVLQAGGQGTIKSIDYAYLRVNNTGSLLVGPSSARLTRIPERTTENYDTPPRLKSEVLDILVESDLTPDAQLWISSPDPVPMTVSSLTTKVSLGG